MRADAALIVAFVIVSSVLNIPIALASETDTCVISTAGLSGGRQGVVVNGECVAAPQAGSSPGQERVEERTIGCNRTGHQVVRGVVLTVTCPTPVPWCVLLAEGGMSGTPFWAYLVQYRVGAGPWVSGDYWCPQTQGQAAAPAPDVATIRDQVVRLLPVVGIGTTDDHVSLVNIQTIFWADTAAQRELGAVVVTGRRVWLRVAFASAAWDFGDGVTDTATAPGKAYDKVGDPCGTKLCPDYFGHVYRDAGPVTVRLRVSWQASWSLDGTHFLPVGAGPITGPAAAYSLTVRQAKGVLVAND